MLMVMLYILMNNRFQKYAQDSQNYGMLFPEVQTLIRVKNRRILGKLSKIG